MNWWIWLGTAIGMLAFLPLYKQILSGDVKQNFATWMLWAAIDGTAAATIIAQRGNFLLPAGYSLACFVAAMCIFRMKTFSWGKFEMWVTMFVALCFVVWYFSGAKMATVASTVAMLIAGIPQLLDTWRKPWESPLMVYVLSAIAPVFVVIGGGGWVIEERFYPVAVLFYNLFIVSFAARRFWLPMPINHRCVR